MAFRRSRTRGRRFASSRTMAWCSQAQVNTLVANGTGATILLADAGNLARSTGLEKKMATLLRIRGSVSILPDTAVSGPTWIWYGIHLKDVGEPAPGPTSFVYGDDEDVLLWGTKCLLSNTVSNTAVMFDIDVKAKRVLESEHELEMNISNDATSANDIRFMLNLRCLFALK